MGAVPATLSSTPPCAAQLTKVTACFTVAPLHMGEVSQLAGAAVLAGPRPVSPIDYCGRMAEQPTRIVWIDTETTGLEYDAQLLEVACVITDFDLNEIAEPYSEVIWASRRTLRKLVPRVREMHTVSGLIGLIPRARRMREVERDLLRYIQTYVPDPKTAPLGGSSVHMDSIWLKHNMPSVREHLHYRLVDVSTIMQLAGAWYPETRTSGPVPTGGHRALGDIRDSIASLRHYRGVAFR